jgi:hypothetical protein
VSRDFIIYISKTRTEFGLYEGSPASIVNWGELALNFKSVQMRHERNSRMRASVSRDDSNSGSVSDFRMIIPVGVENARSAPDRLVFGFYAE